MLKENNGGTIVTTVATSQAIYDIAEEYNGGSNSYCCWRFACSS